MNFLSLQPEQYAKISAKNVLPYLDIPRYIWQVGNIAPFAGLITPTSTGQTVQFSNVQLNQIPDLMIIVCRKQMATQNWENSSSFLAINSISMNFNNQSGILASATPMQLFLISQKNGSSQTWLEYLGNAYNNNNASGQGNPESTIGSMLVLNPSVDFGLLSMYSASSGGQFNCQFSLNVMNQGGETIPCEIVLMCVNSGLFITENGTSSTQTGILTKQLVLDTKSRSSNVDTNMYQRIIGGSLHNLRKLGGFMKHDKLDYGSAMCGAGEDASGLAGSSSGGAVHHHLKKKIHKFIRR
jgi:hypothetical protein